jgi:hypothetical protein
MRAYDPAAPLIYSHVPKTAGTTVREVFRGWFGAGLVEHYADERSGSPPVRHDLTSLQSAGLPPVVFGHFNNRRGFGIDQYYPEATQFVTVLRDPFERAISGYYYRIRHDHSRRSPATPREDLRSYLRRPRGGLINFFPGFVTADNYREMIDRHFIEIGVMEHLAESLRRIARALGRSFDVRELPRLNANPEPPENVADLREQFIANHPLDFEMYDYARGLFTASATNPRESSASA